MLEIGVCPEQARLVLPQGAVVNWVWTGSLYAYFNYVSTRLDPHAQSDAYPMAHDIAKICQEHFPMAWAALIN
jgi:thymidylate synthase (FAD)